VVEDLVASCVVEDLGIVVVDLVAFAEGYLAGNDFGLEYLVDFLEVCSDLVFLVDLRILLASASGSL
tara:strand:- start:545 stop:745 length:201 start_codon:yes stop_codon:yes gene_type:complete